MASFTPPEPPFEPGEPTPPPSLDVPLPPPLVGVGSPWAPIDAENRDYILDWWRMWFRRVFFPWIAAFIAYWDAQWDRLAAYINTWITAADTYITDHAIAGYSFRTTVTDIAGSGTTNVTFTGVDTEHRPLVIGDLVLDQSADGNFGSITALIDSTHATVTFLGSLKGPIGLTGANGHGWWTTVTTIAHSGATAVVITAGDRPVQVGDFVVDQSASAAYGEVTVVTSPTLVTVVYLGTLQGPAGGGGGGGGVASVVGSSTINVDATDPANPVVSVNPAGLAFVESVTAGMGVSVDNTDPLNPVVSTTGSDVESVVGGVNTTVDDTDPLNPVVNVAINGTTFILPLVSSLPAAPPGGNSGLVCLAGAGPFVYRPTIGWQRVGVIQSLTAGTAINISGSYDDPTIAADLAAIFGSLVGSRNVVIDLTNPAAPVIGVANAGHMLWLPEYGALPSFTGAADQMAIINYNGGSGPSPLMFFGASYGWIRVGTVQQIIPYYGIQAPVFSPGNTDTVWVRSHMMADTDPLNPSDSLQIGDMRRNTTTNKLQWWNGTTWETITSA